MNALQFEAVKIELKQNRTGFVLTLNIHPDEIPEELMRDFVGSRYGVAMVRIMDDESPTMYSNRVMKAGMLSRARDFQYWLRECKLTEKCSETEAAEAIRKECGIQSRTELNGNAEAQAKFDKMVDQYERWRKEDDPF